jgi:hypothetical protein
LALKKSWKAKKKYPTVYIFMNIEDAVSYVLHSLLKLHYNHKTAMLYAYKLPQKTSNKLS